MRFTDEFIEEVRSRNDIVDVISGYVQLTHKGTSYKGLCPFHSEKTPSFSVHKGRQMYHCFGCGKSGDVFNFIMEYERDTFSESVEVLARRAGMEIPKSAFGKEDPEKKSRITELREIHKEAALYYYYALYSKSGAHALTYLRSRGLPDEVIKSFGLGYSDRTGTGLYKHLKGKGYTDAQLKETGLFTFDRDRVHDRFWNRVIFPIMDQNRRVIGFGGRVMGDGLPKYLNSPETLLFDKSRNLYGLYAAKSSRKEKMIICEGYMDVIALHSKGFTNAVASLGTALTSAQSSLIRRYAKEAILLYDSDEAGIKAARRAIPILKSSSVIPKVASLAPYKDPDEFLKAESPAELEKRLDNALNGFLFETDQMKKEYDTSDPQGMADFCNGIVRKLMELPDEIERSSYLDSVSRRYSIEKELLKKQLGKSAMSFRTLRSEAEAQNPVPKKESVPVDLQRERQLLSCMSRKKEFTQLAAVYITEYDFTDEKNREIFNALKQQAEEDRFDPVTILNRFEDSQDKSDTAAIFEGGKIPGDDEEQETALKEILIAVKTQTYERALKSTSASTPEEIQRLLEEKRKLEELRALITGGNI